MDQIKVDNKQFLYPPGGILIWIIVIVEVLTFGIALIVFRVYFSSDHESFLASQNILNKNIGLINTIVLITSGYFMATAMMNIKHSREKVAVKWLTLTILTGFLFLIIKGWEYKLKIAGGHVFGSDDFFNFYWMLTGFHFIHVLAGLVILTVLLLKLKKGEYNASNYLDVETGGVFWHMCDLIWILLFPVLYLLQ